MNQAAGARPVASPGKGGAPDAPRPLDTGAVTKRLQQELMGLMASGGDGVSAFPAGDSLFDWVGTINVSGSALLRGGPCAGGLWLQAARSCQAARYRPLPAHALQSCCCPGC